MAQIKKISEEQKIEVNRAIKSFGLTLLSASIDAKSNKLFAIIEKGGAATYNCKKVAEKLKEIFETRSVVLDGTEYI